MTRINKKAVVKYSANQMYALVNDIEAYPDFLPWCTDASITSRNNDTLLAVVSISIGKIKKIRCLNLIYYVFLGHFKILF